MTTFNGGHSQPHDLHNAPSLPGPLRATPQYRRNANPTGLYTRPKHGDCLGRFSLTGPTLPKPSDSHTTESRDFSNVTPWQLPPITCGRRLSRFNLVARRSALMGAARADPLRHGPCGRRPRAIQRGADAHVRRAPNVDATGRRTGRHDRGRWGCAMSSKTASLTRLHGRLRASLPARRRRTRFIELERECVCVTATNPEQEEA